MASGSTTGQGPSKSEIFEASCNGAQYRPWLPRLRSDPPAYRPVPHNLSEFRTQEGKDSRERLLRELWASLPKDPKVKHNESEDEAVARKYAVEDDHSLTAEDARRLQEMYDDELYNRFRGEGFLHRSVGWREFVRYAEAKEAGALSSCSTATEITNGVPLDTPPPTLYIYRAVAYIPRRA